MRKSDIGLMQEQLPNGKVTTSLMRWMSVVVLVGLFIYMYFANEAYNDQFSMYVNLAKEKVITEQTFFSLVNSLVRFEKWIIAAFLAGAFAPKAIQKFIENYALKKEL